MMRINRTQLYVPILSQIGSISDIVFYPCMDFPFPCFLSSRFHCVLVASGRQGVKSEKKEPIYFLVIFFFFKGLRLGEFGKVCRAGKKE